MKSCDGIGLHVHTPISLSALGTSRGCQLRSPRTLQNRLKALDYINFGIGTGATLALFGWLFRDWGPKLRDRSPLPDEVLSARELVSRMAWKRFCQSCGMTMTIGGLLVVFATVGVAIRNPEDSLGFDIVLGAYAVVLVLLMIWAGIFLRQFGSMGIIRPRVKSSLSTTPEKSAAVPASGTATATATAESTSSDEAPVDDKSFEEVAAGRGGLGRFAAFFRRDESSQSSESKAGDETSPTDAVIAEMGASDGADNSEKRLSISDPLVVRVVGWIDPDREVTAPDDPDLEGELAASSDSDDLDETGSNADVDAAGADGEQADDTQDLVEIASPTVTVPAAPATPEDEALVDLRKRRLARLSGTSGDES